MGTITERKGKKGTSFRAQVRVKRKDGTHFSESRSFSTRILAKQWIRNLEDEIEINPDTVFNPKKISNMTLSQAFEKYLAEVEGFGRSKRMGIRFLKSWPIGQLKLKNLKREHFTEHTFLRRKGYPEIGAKPIASSTALQDLQYMKTVLLHAHLVWHEEVDLGELELAMIGLRGSKIITKSKKRTRLLTREELINLTEYFYNRWHSRNISMPLHLIMWLSIYTCRREDEITRLKLENFDQVHQEWLLEDVKHPTDKEGNDKYFRIDQLAKGVIEQLLDEKVRQRMLRLGGEPNLLVPLNARSFAKDWRDGVKMCGIKDLRFHDLRHEALTRLAEDGKSIHDIKCYSLHESLSSLERYINIKRRRHDRIEFDEVIDIVKSKKIRTAI